MPEIVSGQGQAGPEPVSQVPLPLLARLLPETTALLVVDVQNDFCSPNGYMDREGQDLEMVEAMLPRLRRLVAGARLFGIRIVFFQANYASAGDWYLSSAWLDRAVRSNPAGGHVRYPVCLEGDWGFEFVPGIGPEDSQHELALKKHRYSGFVNTELDLILRSHRIRTVVVTGVATNVCVESTARDAFMRDYFVVVPQDCCATYSEEEQRATMWNLGQYFGVVTDSETILDVWSASADEAVNAQSGSEAAISDAVG